MGKLFVYPVEAIVIAVRCSLPATLAVSFVYSFTFRVFCVHFQQCGYPRHQEGDDKSPLLL